MWKCTLTSEELAQNGVIVVMKKTHTYNHKGKQNGGKCRVVLVVGMGGYSIQQKNKGKNGLGCRVGWGVNKRQHFHSKRLNSRQVSVEYDVGALRPAYEPLLIVDPLNLIFRRVGDYQQPMLVEILCKSTCFVCIFRFMLLVFFRMLCVKLYCLVFWKFWQSFV